MQKKTKQNNYDDDEDSDEWRQVTAKILDSVCEGNKVWVGRLLSHPTKKKQQPKHVENNLSS